MGSPDGMCQWSTSTFKNSYGCTALDMLEWRETTEQTDWQAKQPSQVACFLEDLKCSETWDTTSRHKAKDITQLITWGREVLKQEVLDDLPWKDERGLSSIRQTLEPFQRQHWGNFWEMRWREKWAFSSTWIPSWTELIWKHKSITWLWTPAWQPRTKSIFVKYFVLVKFVITFQDLEYAQHLWLFCLKHKNSYKTH